MADIHTATLEYERWFSKHTKIVQADLYQKHKLMRTRPFILLRGTFYRWAELFPAALPELMKAPIVLSAGDLHIENFAVKTSLGNRVRSQFISGTDDRKSQPPR